MLANPARRAGLRATLPRTALLLAGCTSAFIGPAASRDGMARLQPLLTPEDGPIEFAAGASWWDMRLHPSLADALLLGVRNDPLMGVVAVTERSLIGAHWTGEMRGYALSFRIRSRDIVAIAPFGPTTNIIGNRIGSFEVETNTPRHIPLGGASRTGLFRIMPDTAEVWDAVRARAPQAGADPR